MRDARLRESAPHNSGLFRNTPAGISIWPDDIMTTGSAALVVIRIRARHDGQMIVTHTMNADGARRVYLNGKGSVECYIEPAADNRGWTFHLDQAVTGNVLSEEELRTWAIHTLTELSDALNVAPQDLKAVPFECIAALHESDPFANRRLAVPRRKAAEHCFMATAPNVGNRPRADYRTEEHFAGKQRTRS